MTTNFETNIFINCPFDKEYDSLLRPLLFTIVFFGFTPRIASERGDSLELRITKILELIKTSKYSIHDLSRLQAKKKGEISRLNMPFELGIDYGCRLFSSDHLTTKKCLILEARRYKYMEALSDLNGVNIKAHKNTPAEIVTVMRNWFSGTVGLRNLPSPTRLWEHFTEFTSDFYDKRKAEGFTDDHLNMMPVPEYIDHMKEWIRDKK